MSYRVRYSLTTAVAVVIGLIVFLGTGASVLMTAISAIVGGGIVFGLMYVLEAPAPDAPSEIQDDLLPKRPSF